MKKVVAVLLCVALLAAAFAVQTAALTEEEANAGYYLVGTMTDWQIDSSYLLGLNPKNADEYLINGVALTTSDAFKIVYTHDGNEIDSWYPVGTDNNCTLKRANIDKEGLVDIYFRPNMDGSGDWYFGCIFAEWKSEKSADVVPPTVDKPSEIDGGYYIVFKGDDYRVRERNRMNREWNLFVIRGVTLSVDTPFKIAYSQDLKEVTRLYPEGEDNDYISRFNSRWMTVEFTPDGNNDGDSSDVAWYDGYVRAYPCEPPQEDSTEYVRVTEKEMKVNRYEDAFYAQYPTAQHICSYEELYYHKDMFGSDDWTLVKTPSLDSVEGSYYGVFDDVVVFGSESYPFEPGYGVYDAAEKTFYSIGAAWNKGYDDLHDVFCHIVPQYSYTYVLGDADFDGELTIIDVTRIMRCLANIEDLEDDEWVFKHHSCRFGNKMNYLTDYDCDGDRTVLDATRIQRALVGIGLYPHDFTASVKLEKDGDSVKAVASSSFGEEPVQYCYRIESGVYASSVYGDDFGRFHPDDVNPEPGDFQITTGYIADEVVELPLTSLTYNDVMKLTVTARDADGSSAQTAVIWFRNVY